MTKAVIIGADENAVTIGSFAQLRHESSSRFGQPSGIHVICHFIGKEATHIGPTCFPKYDVRSPYREINTLGEVRRTCLTRAPSQPALLELCERLDLDGYRIAFASAMRSRDSESLARFSGDRVFLNSEIPTADPSEPTATPFSAALQSLGEIERDEIVVIGDKACESKAAGEAGFRTIGLLSGGESQEMFLNAGCQEVYKDHSDLLKQYDRSLLTDTEMY